MTAHPGWIGVDFDATLAHYTTWQGAAHCGAPVPTMVERVKRWLAAGYEVRIFTARIWPVLLATPSGDTDEFNSYLGNLPKVRVAEARLAVTALRAWCRQHIGVELPLTCVKDMEMIELWDDRAVQVVPNTGEPIGHSTRGLE